MDEKSGKKDPLSFLTEGFATYEGTKIYKDMMIEEEFAHRESFRKVFLGKIDEGKESIGLDEKKKNTLFLSSLGMGTYLGAPDSSTDKLLINAIKNSLNYGINVIDTAINYRFQRSERCIGIALKDILKIGFKRENFFISSKIGYIPGDYDAKLNPKEYINKVLNFFDKSEIINYNCIHPKYLEHQLFQSLINLNLRTLDLLYLHNTAESQLGVLGKKKYFNKLKAAFEFLEHQVDERKIKYYGMATWECFREDVNSDNYLNLNEIVNLAKTVAAEVGHEFSSFKFIMLPINLLMQEAISKKNQDGKTLIEKAKELGIYIFGASPLLQGSVLNYEELFIIEDSEEGPKLLFPNIKSKVLKAIQFIRSIGLPVICPLIGHKQNEHVEQNLSILKIKP
ncbi:MAG: aldo/keto reductase [Promethearchaeota archaeon]